MSKVVLVCSRDRRDLPRIDALLPLIASEIIPDNIEPRPAEYFAADNLRIALMNPGGATMQRDMSILLGHLVGKAEHWWRPGTGRPDGAYAIFRTDDDRIELASDRLASRTMWYVMTDSLFVASTSQRAITILLGTFEPNLNAALWMLSSGSLGPGNAWDERVRRVEPDSKVTLDRNAWSINVDSRPVEFIEERQSHAYHRKKLEDAIDNVFGNMDVDFSNAVLPLSGGFDSRGLLLMLRGHGLSQCVTWGLASSRNDKRNDAYIAQQVAEYFGLEHQYLLTDYESATDSTETIINRILVAGEGRTARISGYTDGLAIWKQLFERNVRAIIRGDMPFGVDPTATEFESRRLGRLTLLSDFHNLPAPSEFDLPEHELGEYYSRRPGETLELWRDRCYQTYAVPAQLAALTDFKSSYVEVINPLLSNSIVDCTRTQPDAIRTDKQLWREIVRERGPDIPFAETSAPAKVSHFLKKGGVVDVVLSELDGLDRPAVVTPKLVQYVKDNIQVSENMRIKRGRLRKMLRPIAPSRLRGFTRQFQDKNRLDANILAFRAFLVCRMSKLLQRDATMSNGVPLHQSSG